MFWATVVVLFASPTKLAAMKRESLLQMREDDTWPARFTTLTTSIPALFKTITRRGEKHADKASEVSLFARIEKKSSAKQPTGSNPLTLPFAQPPVRVNVGVVRVVPGVVNVGLGVVPVVHRFARVVKEVVRNVHEGCSHCPGVLGDVHKGCPRDVQRGWSRTSTKVFTLSTGCAHGCSKIL